MGDVTDLISIPITDGASLLATVKTNAQGVHTIGLECEPTKPMGLVLHWGVIRPSTGAEWQLLPPELNPPGTTVYKQKALQSPFPAFGALQLVLDPGVVAVEFCLTSSSTGEWFNDAGRNFRIELAPAGVHAAAAAAPPPSPRASDGYAAPTYDLSRSPPPPPPSTPPPSAVTDASLDLSAGMDILYGVAAYLRWEELGKPRVDERQRSDIYAGAVNHITERQRRGESIESLEREFGLPPGLVRKTALEAGGGGGAGAGAAPCRRRRRRCPRRRARTPPPPTPSSPRRRGPRRIRRHPRWSSPPRTSRVCATSARAGPRCCGARSSTWATGR